MIASPQEKRALACARAAGRWHPDMRDGLSQGGQSGRAIREPPRRLGRVEAGDWGERSFSCFFFFLKVTACFFKGLG